MSAKPAAVEVFKTNVLSFTNVIYDIVADAKDFGADVPASPEIISLARTVVENTDAEKLIHLFIKKTIEHWEKIRVKDLVFFREKAFTIFAEIPADKIEKMNQLYDFVLPDGAKLIDSAIEEQTWAFLHSFVKSSIRYIHYRRKPVKDVGYTEEYFTGFSVKEACEKWGISPA
jgi:hypothetical protein